MIPINQQTVTAISKQPNSKNNPGKDNPTLYQIHSSSLTNMTDLLRDFSEYEMAHFINNNERWIQNRSQSVTSTYSRADILMVDLGAHNFRYEPSFPHPCVVVKNTRQELLVVPCSTKKYGKGYPEVIDATPADGFTANTGIQTHSYRWICKNRVMHKMGQASSRVMDELDKLMLSHIPSHKLIVNQKKHDIDVLNQQLESANKQIEQLKKDLLQKDDEIRSLKESLLALQEAAATAEDTV